MMFETVLCFLLFGWFLYASFTNSPRAYKIEDLKNTFSSSNKTCKILKSTGFYGECYAHILPTNEIIVVKHSSKQHPKKDEVWEIDMPNILELKCQIKLVRPLS